MISKVLFMLNRKAMQVKSVSFTSTGKNEAPEVIFINSFKDLSKTPYIPYLYQPIVFDELKDSISAAHVDILRLKELEEAVRREGSPETTEHKFVDQFMKRLSRAGLSPYIEPISQRLLTATVQAQESGDTMNARLLDSKATGAARSIRTRLNSVTV